MTSWAREPKHSSTSFEATLGRNGRSQQGVQLHYVISFLGVRGPGVLQPSTAGRGWGRGRRLLSPPLRPLLQTSANLRGRQALPSKCPSFKQAPPSRG